MTSSAVSRSSNRVATSNGKSISSGSRTWNTITSMPRNEKCSRPLHHLADSLIKRGIVVLISDLLDDPEQVNRGLKHFQFRGIDVIVFHVLDPDDAAKLEVLQ